LKEDVVSLSILTANTSATKAVDDRHEEEGGEKENGIGI